MFGAKRGSVGSPVGSAAKAAVGSAGKGRGSIGNFLSSLGSSPATSFLQSLGATGKANKSINRLSDRRKNRLGK